MQSMQAETERVAHHLHRAEALAARRDASTLTRLQRVLRQLLLRELARYREAGRFPKNRSFAILTPYFIDADGTRCAVAHLLEVGGEGALVAQVARERNNAYVRELADEPRLLAWLQAAGLTVEDAAAIQPSYCSLPTDCICGGDFSFVQYPVPARGVLEGVVLPDGTARVDRTYGESLGVTIGSTVPLQDTHPAGTHILAPIDAPVTTPLVAIRLDDDGIYACSSQGVASAPPLNVGELAAAVLSSDCVATLREIDPAWSQMPSCDDGGGLGTESGRGCSASGADADPVAVGILLALVAVLVRRGR